MNDLSEVRSLLTPLPTDLVDELLSEFQGLRTRFLLRDWGPSALNGGRFAEAALRILEWQMDGRFTPIGKQLDRLDIVKRIENDTSLPDGLRSHARRCTELLLDIRNKRDVAHLGPDVDVNRMDAELVLRLCSWVLAETVREFGQSDPDSDQGVIDKISAEQVPWIEEVDGDLLVVAMNLSASDRTLLALHHAHPNAVPIKDLQATVGYANTSRFRNVILKDLASDRRIHVKNDNVIITGPGVREIEAVMVNLKAQT